MTSKQAERIIEELKLLRAEVIEQTVAARETQAVLLAIAAPKQTANQWLREQNVEMWPVN